MRHFVGFLWFLLTVSQLDQLHRKWRIYVFFIFTPESFPDSSALVVGHDHIQTHLEAAQHNHSLICRPLEQTESSALLTSTSVLAMRDERVLPFTLLRQIYAACPRIESETAHVQKLSNPRSDHFRFKTTFLLWGEFVSVFRLSPSHHQVPSHLWRPGRQTNRPSITQRDNTGGRIAVTTQRLW